MLRTARILSFIFGVISSLFVVKSDRVQQWGSEMWARMEEQRRIADSIDRAALAERMRAQASVRENEEKPIKDLQAELDILQDEITNGRAKGRDVRPLEKAQDQLETEKARLERQL